MNKPPGVFNVAVEAMIIKNKKILITKRSYERDHAPGEWETLTGRVDQGETFEEAVKREVMEEVGLRIKVLKPFHTFHFYRGASKAEHLGVSFVCKYISGKIVLDKTEQIDFKWVKPEEAKKYVKDKSVLSSIDDIKTYIESM